MHPDQVFGIILNTALVTLFVVIAALALAAAARWRAGRTTALLLAWAMGQHAINQGGSLLMSAALGVPPGTGTWIATMTGYFIAVPWARLMEQVIGRGWKSSIRRTWQAFLACAIMSVAFDAWTGRPGAAAGFARVIIAGGAFVGLLNLLPGVVHTTSTAGLTTLRAGYGAFLLLVVHDALAGAGVLPWSGSTGALGVVIFVGSLAFTVVSRTLRGQRELQAIEHELATARRIQASLIPSMAPRLDGASVAFRYVPAAAVAGDMFEFLATESRRTGILVADVSGHGVPAALIASMVKVAAAAQRPHAHDPERVLAGVHLAIANELPRGHFVTAVYVYLDLDRGVLRHASAGHPPALLYRAADGAVTAAGRTGPLIVGFAPAEYPAAEVPVAPGDRIVLYTDGVVEAMRRNDEMFGVERLSALVARNRQPPEALANDIVDAVSAFAGRRDSGLDDDCTIVTVEITRASAVRAAR